MKHRDGWSPIPHDCYAHDATKSLEQRSKPALTHFHRKILYTQVFHTSQTRNESAYSNVQLGSKFYHIVKEICQRKIIIPPQNIMPFTKILQSIARAIFGKENCYFVLFILKRCLVSWDMQSDMEMSSWYNHAKTLPRDANDRTTSFSLTRSKRTLSPQEPILGSSPNPSYRFTNKPEVSIVEGSRPKPMMLSWNRPVLNMTCSDIVGCHPCAIPFLERTNRSVNPLLPSYKLPSFEKIPEVVISSAVHAFLA